MADPLEWYATDGYGPWESYASQPVIERAHPGMAIYGRVAGTPGAVVWTTIWEPLYGGRPPEVYPGGPIAAGQFPVDYWSNLPNSYVPSNPNAVAVIWFWEPGIMRLRAVAGGIPIAGELVLTISGSSYAYPNLALTYESGGPPPTEFFWTQHRNTYEVP